MLTLGSIGRSGDPDRGGRHGDAELGELSLDPEVTPSRVLPSQPKDQVSDLGIKRRPARSTCRAVGPLPSDQLAVPAKKRLRCDKERGPSVPGKGPARRDEQDAVPRAKRWSTNLSAKDLQLVAKHENLDILRLLVGSGGRNAKDPPQKEVDKGQQRGARCYWLSPQRANREFVHPSRIPRRRWAGYRIEPPPDISPRRLISRLEGRMIRVAKDAIQAIMQSSRR